MLARGCDEGERLLLHRGRHRATARDDEQKKQDGQRRPAPGFVN
jgi:hypothetical protein